MSLVHIQPRAAADAEEAAAWYEQQQVGLGVEFVLELDAVIDRAAANPELYEVQYRGVRRVLLRRFPYAVYFFVDEEVVEIFATLHQHRESEVWRDRVSD